MIRRVLRPVALFGTVAAMLTATVVLTLSHSTVSMSGVGILKCYGGAGIQKRVEFSGWALRRSAFN